MKPDAAGDVTDLERRVAEYYDREGADRLTMPMGDVRLGIRQGFVEQLRREGRRSLLEIGSGPGRDATVFATEGFDVVAVDRSRGHARLCTDAGVPAIQASVLALPFAPATFDAGWTMSTLLHVPDVRWDDAMRTLVGALVPRAPLAIGLWGGVDEEGWVPPRDGLPERFFSRRSHDRLQDMLARHGTVESFDTWPGREDGWSYQLALLRTAG